MEDYNQYGDDDDDDGGRQELDNGNDSDDSGPKDFASDENNCSDEEENNAKQQARRKRGGLNTSQEKIEVTLDDIEDDDDQECLLDYNQKDANLGLTGSSTKKSSDDSKSEDESGLLGSALSNLMNIKESKDKGLADMETGSEVYMSELLVSIHTIQIKFNPISLYRLVSTWKISTTQMNKTKKT